MAEDIFDLKKSDLKIISKMLHNAPKIMQKVTADTLNTLAFQARRDQIKIIQSDNTVRNLKLLGRIMRIEKAKHSMPIRDQVAKIGSVETKRHDGFVAIEQGKPVKETMFNDEGRVGGNESGKAKKIAKGNATSTRMKDVGITSKTNKWLVLYLQRIQARKSLRRKPFYMPKRYKRMQKGVYKFVGGRVGKMKSKDKTRSWRTLTGDTKIVRISKPAAKYTPKATDWLERSARSTITPQAIKEAMVKSGDHHFRQLGFK